MGILFSQKVNSLEVEFNREIIQEAFRETTSGKIYYQDSGKIIVQVTAPLQQWMIFEEKALLIYYPEEQKAIRIRSKIVPLTFSFFEAFLGVIKEDFGLSELGYTILDIQKKEDRLVSVWSPPESFKKYLGKSVLEFSQYKIISYDVYDSKDKIIKKTLFSNHITFGANEFPMEIVTETFQPNPKKERIQYENLQLNQAIPEEISSFRIPPEIPVKEMEW